MLYIGAFMALMMVGGHVAIDAFGYGISTSLGVFIIFLLVSLYVGSLVIRAIRAILFTPKTISNAMAKRHHRTGMQSLTYGLSAVAAGDVKAAVYYTKKAQKLLKDDYGLVALLSGLTARLKGDEKQAEKSFKTLLNKDETAFLGIRGLLQTALERGDDRYARVLARQAYNTNPNQPWILKTLYELELKYKNFDEALRLLDKAQKTRLLNKDEAARDRAAIYLETGEVVKAYKSAPQFLPAILAILKIWASEGRRRKCLNLIKKTWAVSPHPDLLDIWISLKKQDNAQRILAWVEELQRTNTDDASSNLYTAEIALRFHLNAQAKRFLEMAIDDKPTMRAYQLMARIDPAENIWQDLIAKGAQDKTWVCNKTGQIFDQWHAFNGSGQFNTIRWMYPEGRTIKNKGAEMQPFFLTDIQKAA